MATSHHLQRPYGAASDGVLTPPTAPETSAAPANVAPTADRERPVPVANESVAALAVSPAALAGHRQLQVIASVLVFSYIAGSGLALVLSFSVASLTFALLRLMFVMVITEHLRDAHRWARFLCAGLCAINGVYWISAGAAGLGVQTAAAVVLAGLGLAYCGIGLHLAASRDIAECTRPRVKAA